MKFIIMEFLLTIVYFARIPKVMMKGMFIKTIGSQKTTVNTNTAPINDRSKTRMVSPARIPALLKSILLIKIFIFYIVYDNI